MIFPHYLQPLEVRESQPDKAKKVEHLGIWCNDMDRVTKGVVLDNALEAGR